MRLLAACLLRLYPRWWRDRYEAEMRGLLDEHRVRLTTLVDLVAGAVDARLNPTYRRKEELMSASAPQGDEAIEPDVAADPDEASREEIRAKLQAREASLRASADAVENRKDRPEQPDRSRRKPALNQAEEAALGPALFTNPGVY